MASVDRGWSSLAVTNEPHTAAQQKINKACCLTKFSTPPKIPDAGERFACLYPKCGKIFDKPSNLSAHMRGHSSDKPFVCTYHGCDRRFAQAGNLEKHLRSHQIPLSKLKKKLGNQKLFICPQPGCKLQFSARSSLQVHIRSTHAFKKSIAVGTKESEKIDHPKTMFACKHPGCKQSFNQGLALRQHLCETNPGLAAETAYYQQLVKGLVTQLGSLAERSPGLTAILQRLPAYQQARSAVGKMLPVPLGVRIPLETSSKAESLSNLKRKQETDTANPNLRLSTIATPLVKSATQVPKKRSPDISLNQLSIQSPTLARSESKSSLSEEDSSSDVPETPTTEINGRNFKRVRFSNVTEDCVKKNFHENKRTEVLSMKKWLSSAKGPMVAEKDIPKDTTTEKSEGDVASDAAANSIQEFIRRANKKGFHGDKLKNFMLNALEGTGISLPQSQTHFVEDSSYPSNVIEVEPKDFEKAENINFPSQTLQHACLDTF